MDPRAADSHDVDLGPRLTGVIWFLAVFSLLFVSLRAYCKMLRKSSLWWDDYSLVASWLSLLAAVILQTVCVRYGLGKHTEQVGREAMPMNTKLSYAAGFCCIVSLALSKTSFSLTLLRISSGWTKAAVWFVLLSTDVVLVAHATIQWVQCWPTPRLWDWNIPGSCMEPGVVETYNTFSTLYSGSMDIVLALLPWKIIWAVQINKKEKIGVVIAMSTSIFAGVISFVKVRTHYAITDPDIATNVNMFIFGTSEPAMTIIAASIPFLRHLFRRENYSSGGRTTDHSFNNVSLRSLRRPEGTIKLSNVQEDRALPRY